MGNQLTGIAPSQILPVEHYLQDIPAFEYEAGLGSTRFFKVAKARHAEGYVVVKVFVIHDPSLPLETYKRQLDEVDAQLRNVSNVLPYQRASLNDKAALLIRMYVKDSLYDRMSTRPFLSLIEKKFIAFQLLCALNQCHKLEVYHGDIKSENIMVTSWNWIHLTDFASFKPAYIPEDNPADFNYFFDTSRRRTCYIAPERFVESSWRNPDRDTSNLEFATASAIQKGDLTVAMDIFSAGCVLTELFTEGKPPFDLSQLLAYRTGDYTPAHLLHSIDDVYIRDLVKHMMQKDPKQRLSAEEYMVQQNGKAFPNYFYSFLKTFMQRFASPPVMSEDDKVSRIKRDWDLILEKMGISESDPESNASLVIIISLITSCSRNLQFEKSKLTALELLVNLSAYVCAEVVLDRIIPFLLYAVNDNFPQVRAEAVRSITKCVVGIKSVPLSDANIFPEYILPQISHLTQDSIVSVRVAFAENIALLAETASRFLEIAQLSSNPVDSSQLAGASSSSMVTQSKASYDVELQALHEMIQQKVVYLICDPENIVKQTLLANGITQLCVFFGRQKASDVLLSHMITFLNDKRDWHLRAAFFSAVVGIAAYIGWQSSTLLQPLLQQGLADTEEHVVHETLTALQTLVEMGLIRKTMKQEFLDEVRVLLVHPSLWVRQGAVGLVCAMARTMNIADVHCNLLPSIQPYLKNPIIQVNEELVLLNNLTEPLTRGAYDCILRSKDIDRIFQCIQERELARNTKRAGHSPNYRELDNTMGAIFRKLQSEGMTVEHENKLLAMKEYLTKLHRAKGNAEGSSPSKQEGPGVISLETGSRSTRRRHCDLMAIGDPKYDLAFTSKKHMAKRKPGYVDPLSMNEDWKAMFGSQLDPNKPVKLPKSKTEPHTLDTASGISDLDPMQHSDSLVTGAASLSLDPRDSHERLVSNTSKQITDAPHRGGSPRRDGRDSEEMRTKYAGCKLSLRQLVYHKKELYSCDQQTRDLLDNTVWESRPPPAGWKPKGLLVAHLHEHRGAVNRVQVNQEHTYFATCSNDGSVKVFDCSRMEGKSVTNRSRMTYNKQEGQIKCLTFCQSSESIASVADKGDSGSIHVFRVETSGAKYSVLHTRKLDVTQDGMVVDMTYFDTGSQHVLAYATVYGYIIGWDLRSPAKEVWRLQNNPKHGLITSFAVHPMLSWMSVGTSGGVVDCWDLRFQLPATSVTHPRPTGARIRRLIAHAYEQSTVISAVQGNNEVSFWDLETGSRQKTLWASTAPPLSLTQANAHSANGLCLAKTDNNTFLLAAGSDMRVRYWDLSYPANSHIITGAATDPPHNALPVSYRSRLIEGTEVVQETYGTYRPTGDEAPRKGHDLPPTGHHDIITDISICQPGQCFMITCSRDGVVKVWK